MCCRRRRQQPLVVTLGTAAYTAYQTRQAKRAEDQETLAPPPAHSYQPEQTLDDAMRTLNLEKDDIPPPDYDDVIVHRTMVDDQGRDIIVDDRDFGREKDAYLSDDSASSSSSSSSSLRDIEGQPRILQPDEAPTFSWAKAEGGVEPSWKDRKAAWKAAKSIAREERKARKAERCEEWRARRAERRGGRRSCCRC